MFFQRTLITFLGMLTFSSLCLCTDIWILNGTDYPITTQAHTSLCGSTPSSLIQPGSTKKQLIR